MVVFPNCKINIGLNVLDKRQDGYHNLETVFIPVPLKDSLEVIRSKENTTGTIFSQSGVAVDGNINDNLCVKAWHLLLRDFPQLPSVQMHLHKAIPIGAGLGGGSADGAFALQLFNDKFNLNLSVNQLIDYALQLGSDCPFFIINQPSFATGRGEQLEPVDISLAGYQLILINPGIHINTGWAFAQLSDEPSINRQSKNLKQHIQDPVEYWRNSIVNDFESVVFEAYPQLQQIKNDLYNNQAVYAGMSGSGSTLFALFEKNVHPQFQFPGTCFITQILL